MKQNNHIDISIGNHIVHTSKLCINLIEKEIDIVIHLDNAKNRIFLEKLYSMDKATSFIIKNNGKKIPYNWCYYRMTIRMSQKEAIITFVSYPDDSYIKDKFGLK